MFPDQEEHEGGGTHGEIAKHLQRKTVSGSCDDASCEFHPTLIHKIISQAHLCGGVYVVTEESSQSCDLTGEVRQSPVVPQRNSLVHFGCVCSVRKMKMRQMSGGGVWFSFNTCGNKTFLLSRRTYIQPEEKNEETQISSVTVVSPVDHKPRHSQHASHPGAAHHPATHKQSGDVDGLETENCSNVEINRLHDILREHNQAKTPFLKSSILQCICQRFNDWVLKKWYKGVSGKIRDTGGTFRMRVYVAHGKSGLMFLWLNWWNSIVYILFGWGSASKGHKLIKRSSLAGKTHVYVSLTTTSHTFSTWFPCGS